MVDILISKGHLEKTVSICDLTLTLTWCMKVCKYLFAVSGGCPNEKKIVSNKKDTLKLTRKQQL